MGPLVNDKVDHLDDGTPLRPLGDEQQDDRQHGRTRAKTTLAAAIGVLGGVVKHLLGDDVVLESEAGQSRPQGGHKSKLSLVASRDESDGLAKVTKDSATYVGESSAPIDPEVVHCLKKPVPRATFQFNYDAEYDDVQIEPKRTSAVNDNDALYRFTPGIGITLEKSGKGHWSLQYGGHYGGSGDSGRKEDPGYDDNNTDSGSEDRDDSDSDQGTGPAPPSSEARQNRAPEVISSVRLNPQLMNTSVLISMSALLAHASDPDSDALHVINPRASLGAVTAYGPDVWLYTPERGHVGEVTFSYQVSDGELDVAQLASLELIEPTPVTISGTESGDVITGTPLADVIDAGAGDDIVIAREGDDTVYGRSGDDRIVGGDGDDVIFGHEGNDQIFAGAGNDTVFAGSGDDIVQGDSGDDLLHGDNGNDTFVATEDDGNDVIDGGDGTDTYTAIGTSSSINVDLSQMRSSGESTGKDVLISIENVTGSSVDDRITGSDETNVIHGSGGSDEITGLGGDDDLYGDDGNDTFVASVNDGNDHIDGGEGKDLYDVSSAVQNTVIDLLHGQASGAEIGTDRLVSVENATGGSGNDTIIAGEGVNVLTGGPGDDVFVFTAETAGYGYGYRDTIEDFEIGDRISLKKLNREAADTLDDLGFEKFVLISQGAEFTEPGQVKFRYDTIDAKEFTVLEVNTDGNAADHEFEIELKGHYELTDNDFYRDGSNSGPG